MERQIPKIMRMLRTAADGDSDPLQELGVQRGFEYDIPHRLNPSKTTKEKLEEEIKDLVFFAEAANRLYMYKWESVVRKAISHMIHSYYCLFDPNPKIGGHYSGQEFTTNLCNGVDILKDMEGHVFQNDS